MNANGRLLAVFLVAAVSGLGASACCDDEPPISEVVAKEKARREAERAKGKGKPTPTYTDEDLPRGQKKGDAAEAQGQSDSSASSSESSETSELDGWKSRVQDERETISKIEGKISGFEARVAELRADDGLGRATAVNREREVRQEISATLEEMKTLQESLTQAREKLDEVLEAARRAGVPFGQLE